MRTLAAVFKALSDETRLKMLGLLQQEGELCVCEFVAVLDISQSKASRHLRYLVHTGLLEDRRRGIWVHYRIAERPGPLQAAALEGLRQTLPPHVMAQLKQALRDWKRCCPPAAAAGDGPARGRRALR